MPVLKHIYKNDDDPMVFTHVCKKTIALFLDGHFHGKWAKFCNIISQIMDFCYNVSKLINHRHCSKNHPC